MVSNVNAATVAGMYANQTKPDSVKETEKKSTDKTSTGLGKTIGKPELSKEAKEYYEQLKSKYKDMDFILVSTDMKEAAKAQAGSFANPYKMVVLIDEEKIEKMATDEEFRKKYEGIIAASANQMSQMKDSLSATSSNIKGFGIQIQDDGTAKYFAVVDRSLELQRERIEKKAEEKAAEKKEAKKEAAREALEESWKNIGSKDKVQNNQKSEDLVMVTASSMEELVNKLQDMTFEQMSNTVQTDAEKMVGQHIDFRG